MELSAWKWIGFGLFILIMLTLDLGLFNRKSRTIGFKESAIRSGVWVTLAILFAGAVWFFLGQVKALQFFTGYLVELSLSVDNLFVFLLVFSYFKVPEQYQHRVLLWGVLGALVMRVVMIFAGVALIDRFHWIIYVLGIFLIYTGFRILRQGNRESNPEKNVIVRMVTRFVPITRQYVDDKFFTLTDDGRRVGTLLLLVLLIVEVTDLLFAVDSIPAIFGITTDRFIVYSSNVIAILGLRSVYFLLGKVAERFHYLNIGLAIVLAFIGTKMVLTAYHIEISTPISLIVVGMVLAASIAISLMWPKNAKAAA